jgi:hypothetical protein
MFGLTKLRNALAALADNLTALAGTVAEVNAGVRARLALDGPEAEAGTPGRRGAGERPHGPTGGLAGAARGARAEARLSRAEATASGRRGPSIASLPPAMRPGTLTPVKRARWPGSLARPPQRNPGESRRRRGFQATRPVTAPPGRTYAGLDPGRRARL